jgi:hypothetical protein
VLTSIGQAWTVKSIADDSWATLKVLRECLSFDAVPEMGISKKVSVYVPYLVLNALAWEGPDRCLIVRSLS